MNARLLLCFAFLFGVFAAPAARAQDDLELPRASKLGDKKKAKPKKKGYDYDKSKYKSRDLSDATEKAYRFNEKGEPVVPGAKKKSAPPKKKRAEPPEAASEGSSSCEPDETCAPKSEADAL